VGKGIKGIKAADIPLIALLQILIALLQNLIPLPRHSDPLDPVGITEDADSGRTPRPTILDTPRPAS
jgi:hypothetical protein